MGFLKYVDYSACSVYLYMIVMLFQGGNIFNVILQFKTVDMILKGKIAG